MGSGSQALTGGLQGAGTGFAIGGPLGAAIGGGIGALGGALFGGGKSPEEIAAEQNQAAWNQYQNATPDQRRVQLEYLKSVGQLTPEMEQAISQQDTSLKSINVDPRLKSAQMAALNRLNQQGHEGLTLEDRSALNDIQRQNGQAQRGQQEAILQNMQSRGMGGSGAELAARLQSAQSGADQAGQQGLKVAAQAQQNALQAMLSSGNLAGQMGQQEFQNQAQVGNAQDIINRFNTGNLQNVNAANVQAKNQAQEANLNYAKQLEANRVATTNQQKQSDVNNLIDYQAGQNAKAAGMAGANTAVGAAAGQNARNQSSAFTNLLGTAGSVAGGLNAAGAFNSPPKAPDPYTNTPIPVLREGNPNDAQRQAY